MTTLANQKIRQMKRLRESREKNKIKKTKEEINKTVKYLDSDGKVINVKTN